MRFGVSGSGRGPADSKRPAAECDWFPAPAPHRPPRPALLRRENNAKKARIVTKISAAHSLTPRRVVRFVSEEGSFIHTGNRRSLAVRLANKTV